MLTSLLQVESSKGLFLDFLKIISGGPCCKTITSNCTCMSNSYSIAIYVNVWIQSFHASLMIFCYLTHHILQTTTIIFWFRKSLLLHLAYVTILTYYHISLLEVIAFHIFFTIELFDSFPFKNSIYQRRNWNMLIFLFKVT